jgi:hypothetical protein
MKSPVRYAKMISELEAIPSDGPSCFQTPEDWAEYVREVRRAPANSAPTKGCYCEHCEPEFQREMIESGRCDHPETTFTVVDSSPCRTISWEGRRKVGT